MDNASSREPSFARRIKTWFDNVTFATRTILIACILIFVTEVFIGWSPTVQVCLQPAAIVEQYQIRRLFTHAFFHVGILHVAFNMLAFVPIGEKLERQLGTVKFTYLIFLILLLSDLLYIMSAYMLATTNSPGFSVKTCAVGFSGIIFGLIVIHANAGHVEYYSVFGIFPVPAKLHAWVLLIFWQLLIPGLSFLGHLCGILVGQLYVWKALTLLMPSDATVNKIERSLSGTASERFNIILMANTSTPLPTHISYSEGSRFNWRDLFGRRGMGQETTPFTGTGRTVGTSDASSHRFPGQPQFITDPSSSTTQTIITPVIEQPQDDFDRLVEMGFEESSVRAALVASDGDFTTAMNKLTGAT